jgi:hypothetical protein
MVPVNLSPFFRQEPWVLESASADHPVSPTTPEVAPTSPENAEARRLLEEGARLEQAGRPEEAQACWRRALAHAPADLLVRRAMNQLCPSLNRHPLPSRRSRPPRGARFALLLPGQLRCLEYSRGFLEELCSRADLFVCTEERYRMAAASIRCRGHREVRIIEDNMEDRVEDAALPVASMKQWHKLAVCLTMVREQEQRQARRYTHLVKLRTDYLHVNPEWFFQDLLQHRHDGLACASDKVFAGSRDLMMLFKGFPTAIAGFFDGHEHTYWPINVETILTSDDSSKWYGMNWPERLVGQPARVQDLRQVLQQGGRELAAALAGFRAQPDEPFLRLFQGHPRFASEVCFARFLNLCGVAAHGNRAMQGFLRSDRS